MTDTNVHAESSAAPAATTTTTTTTTTTPPPAAETTPVTSTTSSTTATTATTPTSTPPPPVSTEPRPKDPRIAQLHALFPDYDDLILYSVLDSVNGDQDRAIDALLGMNDPEYISVPAAATQEPELTQTELDEQFARRLMFEEQEAQQAAWIAQQEARRPQFAQRSSQQQQQGQQHEQGQQGDTMAEIQQQIGKFAETGKKTFNTFFNKVKAKIQEIDQPKTAQSSTYDPAQYEQRTTYPHVPYAARPQYPRTHAPAPAPEPAYYDPNSREESPPAGLQQGYDVTPAPESEEVVTPPASSTSATIPPLNDTQRLSTSPPIDGGKYGLLPKRPVTLLRPAESTQLERQHSLADSDDGLEYAESPFEGKK